MAYRLVLSKARMSDVMDCGNVAVRRLNRVALLAGISLIALLDSLSNSVLGTWIDCLLEIALMVTVWFWSAWDCS